MPFYDDSVAAGLANAPLEPLPVTVPSAPFSKLFDSALRRENLVGSITESATQPPMGAFDPTFDPWANIKGYEDYARSFVGANNADDVMHIKMRIDKERRDDELLSNGGWRAALAMLAAGQLDLTTLIPLGQVRAVTRGGRLLEGAIRTGASAGAAATVQEAGFQASQITRPISESLTDISTATLLGGVLGGAVGGLAGRARPFTMQTLRDLGDSSAIGGRIFDRELAANLLGRRNLADPLVDDPLAFHRVGELTAARANEIAGLPSREVANPEMWRVVASNLEKAEASREGGIDVVADQLGYLPRGGASEREALAVIGRALQVEAERGGQPGRLLEDAVGRRWGETPPAWVAERAPLLEQTGSVGAARTIDTNLDQETIASALGVEKALVQTSPTLRTGTSPSIEVRRIAHALADQPLDLKKNLEGIPTTQSAESLIKQFQGPLAEAEVGVDDLFTKYRLGRSRRTFDVARLEARDMFGAPEGAMSYSEFRQAVGRAMRRGDEAVQPEVAEAAKLLRSKVFDPLKQRAIDAGLLPEDIDTKTATSYLMRVYDANRIKAQRPQFEDVITRWLGAEQAKKDTIRTRVTSLLGEYELLQSRAVPRTTRIGEIRTELEDLVTSWEGKTSQAARSALAQRAKAEAARAPGQGRLAAADKPVIDAAKTIANTNTRLEAIELRDIARQIVDRILGSPVGRLPYDMEVPHPSGGPPRPDRAAPRGPLAQRSFMIPDELIEPWLESDSREIARMYTRTMAPDVVLAERFGRSDMEAQLQQIQAHYAQLRAGRSEPELKQLDAAMRADLRDVAAMRDRLRGTYGLPADPNSMGNRVYHAVRDLNYLRLLGGMTISAFPDMGRLVMTHGLTRAFGDAIVPMLRGFGEFRLAAREAKLSGTALDMVLDTRAMSMADMLDDYGRWTKYERGLKGLTDRFGIVSLMAPWNSAMKQIAGVIGQTRTLEAIEALVAGQPLRQAERTRLASLGIGPEMAERIDAQFKAHGEKQSNGTWWANSSAWTDRDAIEAWRSALNKEIDTTIVTKGQEVPLWMSGGGTLVPGNIGKMIGQFRSFGLASAQRVMMAGLQKRDMATLNGALMMVGLGMMVYAARYYTNPKAQPLPDPTTPGGLARWIREGVDISGLTGYLFDIHNMIEKASGGGIGISRLTGGPAQSRYANRNTLESILGPTAGLVQDAGQLLGAATKGEWSAGDSSRVRRMIPFQNLIGLRHLFDAAEHGVNQAFGVREPPPPRR